MFLLYLAELVWSVPWTWAVLTIARIILFSNRQVSKTRSAGCASKSRLHLRSLRTAMQTQVCNRRAAACRPVGRRSSLVCQAATNKPLAGACVVKLESHHTTSCKIERSNDKDATLQSYMSLAAENFQNVTLPLGGKISKVDSSRVELVVPRIQLFDVWLQPRAIALLSTFPGRIEFTSGTDDCSLSGSSHVKDFKLDERFNLSVRIVFQWRDEDGNTSGSDSVDEIIADNNTIFAEGRIMIEVDIPPPFSFMPKPVLTAAGNTALAGSTQIIMTAFCNSLARDYNVWAKDPAVRRAREQLAAR